MTRPEPQSVVRFLSLNRCGMVLAAELKLVATLATTRLGAARVGVGSYGESKNENGHNGHPLVTTNACFQAELAVEAGKNVFAE